MPSKPVKETKFENLRVSIFQTNEQLGRAAAKEAASILRNAVRQKGTAHVILATGNSQLTFLRSLRSVHLDWSKINIFHMDEYIDLDPAHPASFPLFLKQHIVNYIRPKSFYPVPPSTQASAEAVCREYEKLLYSFPADLCILGIGENGHIAFNDPPFADFKDPRRVKIVTLEEASRRQQVGEGHFKTLDEVPTHAITLTIPALLAASQILALVPEARKAEAVFRSLTGTMTEQCPASILRTLHHAHLYLDNDSAQKILPLLKG